MKIGQCLVCHSAALYNVNCVNKLINTYSVYDVWGCLRHGTTHRIWPKIEYHNNNHWCRPTSNTNNCYPVLTYRVTIIGTNVRYLMRTGSLSNCSHEAWLYGLSMMCAMKTLFYHCQIFNISKLIKCYQNQNNSGIYI